MQNERPTPEWRGRCERDEIKRDMKGITLSKIKERMRWCVVDEGGDSVEGE